MVILGTSYFVPVALTFTVALLLGFFLGALMMHRRGKYLKSISTHGSAPSSEVAEDILKTFNEYFEAMRHLDFNRLKQASTPSFFRLFSPLIRASLRFSRLLFFKWWSNFWPDNIHVEIVGPNRATVEYDIQFWRWRMNERMVLIRDESQWLVDGKVA